MTVVTAAPARSATRAYRAVLPQLAPFLGIFAVAMVLPFVSNDYWALIGTRAAIYWVLVSGLNLALQLPFCFEVRAPSDRLVSSAPE